MEQALKILLLEDSYTDAEIIQRLVKKSYPGCKFHLATNKNEFLKALDEIYPDVILSDNTLPQFNASDALQIVRQISMQIPFILITGTVSEEFAAGIIKLGADDYILKDRMARLPGAIDTALKQRKALKEITDYKYALDESSIVAITDQKGIILYANDNFCKISKYSKEELVGQDHRIVNSGYHPESYIKNLWVTIANGNIWRGEFRNRAKDGSIYWVDATIIPFLNEQNKPYQYLAIRTDITERKEAEEKIQKSEEQYRDLVENISDLICTHDLNGRILSVNRAAEELIGHKFSADEYLNIKDILAPDKKDEFNEYINKIKKEGSVHGLMKVKTFKGEIHIWEYNNSLKTEGVDTPIVRGYARDITENRMAEEELRKSNERFRYAAQATLDIIWELNFEAKQYMVHEGAEKLFGNERNLRWEIGVKGEYIVEEDRDRVKKSFREARMDPACELWSDEYRVWSIEKTVLDIINHAIFIRDKNGKVIRAIGAITDVTDKKKLETKLLEQQKREQAKITATALEAQEKERNAIGVELHDNVNQILVGTKMLLSTIKHDPDRAKNIVDICIKNLQDAIDENRKIAHTLVSPDLDTDTLPEQLKRLAANMLKTAGVEYKVDAANYRGEFLNRERKIAIYRIAQEQCTNIVKYAKATEVNISISNTDKNLKMIITDNGIGMQKGKKVTGIGLRNINSRLSVFNGTANISTAPGKGFSLEIEILL